MSRRTMLEIQNRTPYALTWAHLERDGAAPANLLDTALAPRRGRVVGEVEPGVARLVCGLDVDGERQGVVGPRTELEPGGATSACVVVDERGGLRVETVDGLAPAEGEGEPAGPYRWNGRRGRTHDKRGRRLGTGDRR